MITLSCLGLIEIKEQLSYIYRNNWDSFITLSALSHTRWFTQRMQQPTMKTEVIYFHTGRFEGWKATNDRDPPLWTLWWFKLSFFYLRSVNFVIKLVNLNFALWVSRVLKSHPRLMNDVVCHCHSAKFNRDMARLVTRISNAVMNFAASSASCMQSS